MSDAGPATDVASAGRTIDERLAAETARRTIDEQPAAEAAGRMIDEKPAAEAAGRMIDERLATVDGGTVQLWGSRCDHCGTVSFPQQDACPRCMREGAQRHALAGQGTLWSWTVQGFPPKSPPYAGSADDFKPYGVGYVELGGEIRVEGILTTADPHQLEIGMAMRVVAIPVAGREDQGLVTYGFAPSAGAPS